MMRVLAGVAVLLIGGALATAVGRRARLANAVGATSATVGCLVALLPVVGVLASGRAVPPLSWTWNVPFGAFTIGMDPLSAWFAAVILGLSIPAAVYGAGYLPHYADRKLLGPPWLLFNLLIAAMVLVVTAHNGLLFLMAWEGMALASYFLVTFEDEQAGAREAGRVYLIASHWGVACLLLFFTLLGAQTGTLDFQSPRSSPPVASPAHPAGSADPAVEATTRGWRPPGWRARATAGDAGPRRALGPKLTGALFLLALVGFGVKAGLMPLHVWLPEAHPAAPSHVSALMSGAMIKTGLYGLLRAWTILGPPPAWWGWLLVVIGLSSGLLGILYALAQRDLKRLLAYSSVENVGIIALGLGIGLLGLSAGSAVLAVLGFAGALLHVWNHAAFKSLLFLGAGAILQAAGTQRLDRLGGLLKRMPVVGGAFLLGAVAICGLPPLNGFLSEFLIYLSALQVFQGSSLSRTSSSVVALAAMGGLALIGGLTAACFSKAVGIVFLGQPRSEAARQAGPPSGLMTAAMLALAGGCVLASLAIGPLLRRLAPVLAIATGLSDGAIADSLGPARAPLASVVGVGFFVLVLVGLLVAWRSWLLRGRTAARGETWGCGYAAPTARMQYTSFSFAQPLTDFFAVAAGLRQNLSEPVGLFPDRASVDTRHTDALRQGLFASLYRGASWGLARLHWLQHGRLNLYVLYVAVTLVILLAWEFGLSEWLGGWWSWLAASLAGGF